MVLYGCIIMNNCLYFRRRSKKGEIYGYCTLRRLEVPLNASECYSCSNREYKKRKAIKLVSKKRVFVSKKTYNQVYEECNGRCALCYSTYNLHYHHIYYRSERKDLIDDPSNGIMLCEECHRLVHSNKRKYQPILLDKKRLE